MSHNKMTMCTEATNIVDYSNFLFGDLLKWIRDHHVPIHFV